MSSPETETLHSYLQLYVDHELSPEDEQRIADLLESSAEARAIVREQQEVKALLHALPRPTAPPRLRAHVLAALDGVDHGDPEVDDAMPDAPLPVPAERPRGRGGRFGAFVRGGLVMAPAAAAALALFFVARGLPSGVDLQTAPGVAANLAELERASPASPTGAAAVADATALEPPKADPEDALGAASPLVDLDKLAQFPIQVAGEQRLPGDIALVSAANAEPSLATVRYVDRRTGARFVDQQRPAGETESSGRQLVHRGKTFHLSRDRYGRPVLQFEHSGVHHTLHLQRPPEASALRLLPASLEHPEFRALLELAEALSGPEAR